VIALLRAIQTPRRREILHLVWNGERSAGDIHRAFGDVTFGAVSQHLRVLEEAGLVTKRSQGRNRYYRARKRELGPLRAWLESQWDSALSRLQLEAELEAARRGPRPQPASQRRTSKRPPSKKRSPSKKPSPSKKTAQ
jgi:DNA-binding transcriptional ArsR family regulator